MFDSQSCHHTQSGALFEAVSSGEAVKVFELLLTITDRTPLEEKNAVLCARALASADAGRGPCISLVQPWTNEGLKLAITRGIDTSFDRREGRHCTWHWSTGTLSVLRFSWT